MNISNPPTIEIIAAKLPDRLKVGKSPRIIGIDIGPINAANHDTIKPNTPPNSLD